MSKKYKTKIWMEDPMGAVIPYFCYSGAGFLPHSLGHYRVQLVGHGYKIQPVI